MGILLCEHNFLDVWIRNKSVRAEIGQILRTHTHTHTHAAKLVVEMRVENITLKARQVRLRWNVFGWINAAYRVRQMMKMKVPIDAGFVCVALCLTGFLSRNELLCAEIYYYSV